MSTNLQKGRKVQQRKTSLLPFYIGLGLVAVVGLVFLGLTYWNRDTGAIPAISGVEKTTLKAPVGKTDEGFWYKGDPKAPVKVIEYADYQCPGCANYATTLGEQITHDYIEAGKVQLVFHEFPLQQHAQARLAATAAQCAGAQDAYWPMHDTLYKRQNEWADKRNAQSYMVGYAQALGLNTDTFKSCVTSTTYDAHIEAAVQSGLAAGVPATPSFSIDGKLISRDQLLGAIQAKLAAK